MLPGMGGGAKGRASAPPRVDLGCAIEHKSRGRQIQGLDRERAESVASGWKRPTDGVARPSHFNTLENFSNLKLKCM